MGQIMTQANRLSLGGLLYFLGAILLALYFSFAAVQGDYGVLRRAAIRADITDLQAQLAQVNNEVAQMENLTERLSEHYLDLDLLDERARDVLGMTRSDEIVIH